MYRCCILLTLPLTYTDSSDNSPTFFTIAKYNFDPGLQEGEEVQVSDWGIGWGREEVVNCTAVVVKRIRSIIPKDRKDDTDVFELSIILEIADKEQVPRICEIFRKLNPGKFKD
jgi:hypothetical protein